MVNILFKSLWAYRGFIIGSVKREFQAKYRNSLFGAVWTIVQPLSMIVVYTTIFSQLMKAKLPGLDNTFAYSIYLCAGVITWGLFSEITVRAQNIFIDHANLLKKLSFPRLCLPTIVIINAGINFVIIFGLFCCFLLLSGNFPGLVMFALIPLLAIQIAFAIGLGITLGVANVFFRDVGQFFGVILQFWFWFTPIVYPVSILPESIRTVVLSVNPMTPLALAYQDIFVYGAWPKWESLALPLILGITLCAFGLRLFRKHSGEMVDEL